MKCKKSSHIRKPKKITICNIIHVLYVKMYCISTKVEGGTKYRAVTLPFKAKVAQLKMIQRKLTILLM